MGGAAMVKWVEIFYLNADCQQNGLSQKIDLMRNYQLNC